MVTCVLRMLKDSSGTVALLSRSSQKTLSFAAKPTPLSARQVLDALQAITQIKVQFG